MRLTSLSVKDLSEKLNKKEISAVELTKAFQNNISKAKSLNVFITETTDLALKQAQESDERRKNEKTLGILDGIPIAIKDNFCTNGIRTTAASKILENFVPPYESTVTTNLLNNGAIFLGKANLDEFAMGSSNLNSAYGKVISPWRGLSNEDFVPGGSSGGSAAAVAAELSVLATGSDTGGSVRQPSSYSGIVGLKPTYGTCSRYGIVAYGSSLDQAGAMAKNVEDAGIMLSVMAGYDNKDSTMSKVKLDYLTNLKSSIKGMKIGMVKEADMQGLDSVVKEHWHKSAELLKMQGAEVIEVSIPSLPLALPVYFLVAFAEMASNLSRFDGVRFTSRTPDKVTSLDELYAKTRSEFLGKEVKQRIMVGTFATSVAGYEDYYLKASKVRRILKNDFDKVFTKVDSLLIPTAPTTAYLCNRTSSDPMVEYLNDTYTVAVNLVGVPAISVPVGLDSNNMPIGMQLITNMFDDGKLLQIAYNLEQAVNTKFESNFVKGL